MAECRKEDDKIILTLELHEAEHIYALLGTVIARHPVNSPIWRALTGIVTSSPLIAKSISNSTFVVDVVPK